MNKKGFMMAELVVVSSIVLVTVVAFYATYNKMYSVYKTQLNYYDVTTLYRLGYYRNIITENNLLDNIVSASESGPVKVYDSTKVSGNRFTLDEMDADDLGNVSDVVYFIKNNNNEINLEDEIFKDIHPTFKDYIHFFNNSVDYKNFPSDYVMIMERCTILDDGNANIDDCNYAYLEIIEESNSDV